MTVLTPEQLAELERLEAAATPGEWRAFVSAISSGYGGIETHDQALRDEGEESVLPTSSAKEDDLLFIAAIRNAAKPLIETVRRLRAKEAVDNAAFEKWYFEQEENFRRHNPLKPLWMAWREAAKRARVTTEENDAIADVIVAGADREITDLRRQLAERDAYIANLEKAAGARP